MWPEPPEIDTSELTALPFASDPSRAAHVLSFAHKRLHHSLSLPTKQHSLLADALVASSTDHPEEGLSNVLNPVTQRLITGHIEAAYYWSSTGSEVSIK